MLPNDNILESLYKMQLDRSEELKYLLRVYAQDTTFGNKKYDCCKLKLTAQRHLEQKIKDSHFKTRNRDGDRLAVRAPCNSKAKGNAKKMRKKTREKTASAGSQKPMFIWRFMRIQARSKTRKAKGRDDLVHLLRQVHHTEIRNMTEKVVKTEVQESAPKLTGKSVPGKANRPHCTNVKRGSCQTGNSCNYWHVPECTKF